MKQKAMKQKATKRKPPIDAREAAEIITVAACDYLEDLFVDDPNYTFDMIRALMDAWGEGGGGEQRRKNSAARELCRQVLGNTVEDSCKQILQRNAV
jgi:hypothetical protein